MNPRRRRRNHRWIRASLWVGVLAAGISAWLSRRDPTVAPPVSAPEPAPATSVSVPVPTAPENTGRFLDASNVSAVISVPADAGVPAARRVRVARIDQAWLDRKTSPLFEARAIGSLVSPPLWTDCALIVRLQGSEVLGQLGADLVCLLVHRSDPTNIGIACVLDSLADPDRSFNDLFAFSVVQYAWATGSGTFSHEIGHNLGCAHDRRNSASTGVFSYSYGHRFTGTDNRTYRTIMAYQPGLAVPYFSNPHLTHPVAQQPLGIAAGLPGGRRTTPPRSTARLTPLLRIAHRGLRNHHAVGAPS